MKTPQSGIRSALLLPASALLLVACGEMEPTMPDPPAKPEYLYPADGAPLGKTYAQWSEAWWKWALSIPKVQNPLQNGPCNTNQSGDVFFLSGNAGGSSQRNCAVPAGKALFFPIVNVVVRACPEKVSATYTCQMATSEAEIRKSAGSTFDMYEVTMALKVDGQDQMGLKDRRAASATFDDPTKNMADDAFGSACSGPIADNTCGVPKDSARISAGDGFWIMLKPLPAGKHEVQWSGKVVFSPTNAFELSVAYALDVAP